MCMESLKFNNFILFHPPTNVLVSYLYATLPTLHHTILLLLLILQVFLVTGGYNNGDSLSSTEWLSSTSSSWTMATNLPRRMYGVRGVTLGGELYMTGQYNRGGWDRSNISYSGGEDANGDYHDEILQWSGSAWVEVGKMKMARAYHAVSTIRLEDEVLQFCG